MSVAPPITVPTAFNNNPNLIVNLPPPQSIPALTPVSFNQIPTVLPKGVNPPFITPSVTNPTPFPPGLNPTYPNNTTVFPPVAQYPVGISGPPAFAFVP